MPGEMPRGPPADDRGSVGGGTPRHKRCAGRAGGRRVLIAPVQVHRLTALLRERRDVFLIGIVLQEIMQAFRAPETVAKVETCLRPLPLLRLDCVVYVEAAALKRRCASRGVAATAVDCLIAQAAIAHRCRLLAADRDFERIAAVSSLRLA